MPFIYIEEVARHVGQEVTIRGWLRHRRSSGKIHFLVVRDGTGDLQAVVSKGTVGEEQFAESAKLTQESSLVLTGDLKADARAQGGYELEVTRIQALQIAEPFPIQPKEHSVGFLMEHRHRGSAQTASTPSCGSGMRSSEPAATSSMSAGSSSWMRRSSRPTPAKAPRPCSRRTTSTRKPT
jgi:aspartyl/asparaginyl-tRNA synthetase